MAADYDTKVYVEVGGDKLVVADGGEIELQSGATFDVQSGANFDLGSFGTSMVVTQDDNYPLGVFGTISTAQTTGSVTQRGIWARMDVDANLSGTSSVMGAELQFRFDGATSIGSGVEAEQYTGAWLYFEQDTSGDTLADYCHASASFASVETHSDLSLSANTHLSGIEIASRLGAANGSAWADTTGTTAALFITKAPAAAGVTASDWPYGIFIENTTTAISIRDCTTGISFPAAFTGTNAILIAGTSTDAIKITGTPANSDIMLNKGATLANTADSGNASQGLLTITDDNLLFVAGGYHKICFGGLPDWCAGTTGTVIDELGWDWVTSTVGRVTSDLAGCALAAEYNSMAVTVSQTGSTSSFASWNELGLLNDVDYSSANNLAVVWGQLTAGTSVKFGPTGCFTAAFYGNIIAGATLTNADGHSINGFRAQSEIAAITGDGKTAAFECLTKSSCQDWDYGLYTAGATIGIQVTDADRVLLGGGYSTADNLPMTTDNHYLVGIFGKMATTEDITLEQRVILGRLGVVAGVTIGSAAGWGQGMSGVKGHIAFYGGADTETYCWHNAGVFGHIQADGVATVNFKDGSHTACFYGHAGLVAASSSRTYVDSGAVIAGIALHSGIGANIENSGTIAGVYIYKDTVGNLDWPIGIDINNSTTGIDVGACTTGLTFTGAQTTSVDISATSLTYGILIDGTAPVDGIHISSNCTGAALNITGVTSDAGILVGANGTELIRTSASHYSVGIFTKINADEDTTRTLRGLWSRFAVPANVQVGSVAGWGEGINAIEGNVKLYGGSDDIFTDIYCWQIAGVWAMLETDDTDHIHFEQGSHAAGLFAHIELGSGVELQTGSAAAAVVAFSNSHASADITNGDYVGVLVDKESGKLSFQVGLKVEDSVATTGIDIGTCTVGIDSVAKARFGSAAGASGIALDATDPDQVLQAHGKITTDVTAGAYAGAYNTLSHTSSLANDVSTFGTWSELYFTGDLTIALANHAASWSVLEMADSGGALTFNAAGTQPTYNATWLAGHAILFQSPDGFALGAGRYAAGLFIDSKIASGYSQDADAEFAAILIAVESLGGGPWYEPFPVGLQIMNGASTTGIEIGACTTGISFTGTITTAIESQSQTCDRFLVVGDMDVPIVYDGSNEFIEIHASIDHATNAKPAFRIRNSGASAMTTGSIVALESTANSTTDDHNLYNVWGINAAAQFKGTSTLLTGGSFVGVKAGWSDLGNVGTISANSIAAGLWVTCGAGYVTHSASNALTGLVILSHQGSLQLDGIFIIPDATWQNAGSLRACADSFIYTVDNIGEFGASSVNWISSGTLFNSSPADVECDARIRLNIGGTSYWIPLYNSIA